METQLYIWVNIGIFKSIISFEFYLLLLFKAVHSGHHEVVRLLINNERYNINEKDGTFGQTALHRGEY